MLRPTNQTERSRAPRRRGAQIGAPGSALVLPAASPYEWQLLCEHVTAAARQRGAVRLSVDGVGCVVRAGSLEAARSCGGCGRSLARVAFRVAWRDLCSDCARQRLASEPGDSGTPPHAIRSQMRD